MPRKAHLIQAQREALAEIIGCISDSPHGDALAGRAFEILRGPLKDLVMDIANGEPDEIGPLERSRPWTSNTST
jgi:hypothetical protein